MLMLLHSFEYSHVLDLVFLNVNFVSSEPFNPPSVFYFLFSIVMFNDAVPQKDR